MIRITNLLLIVGLTILLFGQVPQGTKAESVAITHEADYLKISNLTINQYVDDRRSSINILDNLTKGNLTRLEAMNTMGTLFIFASATQSSFDNVQPPILYGNFHKSMSLALSSLKWYLFNAAKFFETGRADYSILALDNLNRTSEYFQESMAYRTDITGRKYSGFAINTSQVGAYLFKK